MTLARSAAAVAALLLLPACVFMPVTRYAHDPACNLRVRTMELQPMHVASIHGCAHEACVTLLAAAGITAAASAVISGSIVVVGNAVYWLERQGQCRPRDAGDATSPAPAAPPPVPWPAPMPAAPAIPPA